MKGVIAAAGQGSRLYPLTACVSKHLLPVYNKPLIYYPLSTLIYAGIKDICIVVNPDEMNLYKKLLGNGSDFGCNFEFCEQKAPKGIPDVLNYSQKVFGNVPITLILGDNIFPPKDFLSNHTNSKTMSGAKVFSIEVEDPSRYGIVQFDKNMKISNINEKPKNPKSNFAIIGLYVFDEKVYEYQSRIKPSKRGELEIIDILDIYLSKEQLQLDIIKKGSLWFDAGTPDALFKASTYIKLFENKTDKMIGCIEEAAYSKNLISKNKMMEYIDLMKNSKYRAYLRKLLK